MRTNSSSSYSVAGTPVCDRPSRSRSRAPGLMDQIRQILRLNCEGAGIAAADLRHLDLDLAAGGRVAQCPPPIPDVVSPPLVTAVSHAPATRPSVSAVDVLIVLIVIVTPPSHVVTVVAFTPVRGVTAHARARPRAILALVTELCSIALHTLSAFFRCRVLPVPSPWPL